MFQNLFKKKKVVNVEGMSLTELMEVVDKYKANEISFEIGNGQKLSFPVKREGDGRAEYLGEGMLKDFEEQEKRDKGLWGLFGAKQ